MLTETSEKLGLEEQEEEKGITKTNQPFWFQVFLMKKKKMLSVRIASN